MSIERTVQLTADGKARLEAELVHLRDVKMRELFQSVQDANTNNEASDSSEYEEIKDELAYTEAKVRELEQLLDNAEIIVEGSPDGVVALGSRVTVRGEDGITETWVIVSPEEATAEEFRVSVDSPVGEALTGCKAGDAVSVETPFGEFTYTVVEVN
ncbi:MAG TPA: GreA/GreB family elongation factor [Thermomicrobiales bacterium]|nr:GreA/GreB family elongation factor [Thermomicrobiales bacterium]